MGKDLKGKELGKGICQRKDGRYMARITLRNGKRTQMYFDKFKQAEKWLIDTRYDDEHGNIQSSNMTVDTWFDFWLNTLHADVRYNTKRNYQSYYNRRIKETIGCMLISDVKPLHCMAVLNEAKLKGDSHGSMVKTRSVMSSLFSTAVENELINKSPVTKSVKAAQTPKKERTVLTEQQQKEFLEIAKPHSHYEEFMFVLYTGLRAGELQGLKWSDVDWKEKTIHIQRTMYYDDDKKEFYENPTKTNAGDRIIPLTNAAFDILESRRHRKLVNFHKWDFVFLNSEGNITPTKTYNKILKSIVKQMGIEKFSMHNLRHTFASRCIELGMTPKVLQKLLGHERIAMTMDLYVHVSGEVLRSEIERLNSVI